MYFRLVLCSVAVASRFRDFALIIDLKKKLTSAHWFNFTIMFFHQTIIAKRFVLDAIPTTNWIVNIRTALIARWPFIACIPVYFGDSCSHCDGHRNGKNCIQKTNKMKSNCSNWIESIKLSSRAYQRQTRTEGISCWIILGWKYFLCLNEQFVTTDWIQLWILYELRSYLYWNISSMHHTGTFCMRRVLGGCECVTCRILSAPAATLSNIVWLTMTIVALHSPKSQMPFFVSF